MDNLRFSSSVVGKSDVSQVECAVVQSKESGALQATTRLV